MTGKTDKQFFFETKLIWQAETVGELSAKGAKGTISIATPPEFGGEGKPWAAEHLFLSAISSGFMATFLAYSKKNQLSITNFSCNAIGQIEIIKGKYKFTHIHLYPKVFLAHENLREKANLVLEKTHKYCLISNSVNAEIFYHSEVLIGSNPNNLFSEMESI